MIHNRMNVSGFYMEKKLAPKFFTALCYVSKFIKVFPIITKPISGLASLKQQKFSQHFLRYRNVVRKKNGLRFFGCHWAGNERTKVVAPTLRS